MEEVTAYRTNDGKIFHSRDEAENHEKKLSKIKAFSIYAGPDLTEGRMPAQFQGYLLVHTNGSHELFAEDWCYRKYGSRAAYVMGVYGSNAIMESWRIKKVDNHAVEDGKVIGRIEEQFVEKLWS